MQFTALFTIFATALTVVSAKRIPGKATLAPAEFIDQALQDSKIVIFSKTQCPWCDKAKALFEAYGEEYATYELDNMSNGPEVAQTLKQLTKMNTVPNIYINGRHIGGFTATNDLHNRGVLRHVLDGGN